MKKIELEKLEDDFFVNEDNATELLKGFSINILGALDTYNEYCEAILGERLDAQRQYVFCVMLELLAR